jgi:hypothetical protein
MMTIEQADKIDGMGIDKRTNELVLLISDNLSWDDECTHIATLESKLSGYLTYISSGQYLESIPHAKNYPVRIKLIYEYKPTSSARVILGAVENQIHAMNILFSYEPLPSGY